MTPLICKCCGGGIDPVTMVCKYCDTAYIDEYEWIRHIKQENNSIKTQLDKEELYNAALNAMRDYNSTTMTPNEIIKISGLNPIANFGVSVEEANKVLLDLGHYGYQELTQAEYDALSEDQQQNSTYYITEEPTKLTAWDTFGRKVCNFLSIHCNAP